jgi:hypothetical protein
MTAMSLVQLGDTTLPKFDAELYSRIITERTQMLRSEMLRRMKEVQVPSLPLRGIWNNHHEANHPSLEYNG